jgi:hypothetical protein
VGCVDCSKVTPPANMHPSGCSGACQFMCNSGYNDCDGVSGCECYGTCAGLTCVPYDAGSDGGSCVPNTGGCTPDGVSCGTNNQCCGCKCLSNTCCFQPGKIVNGSMAFLCCSGSCNPIASPEAGPMEGGMQCQCN